MIEVYVLHKCQSQSKMEDHNKLEEKRVNEKLVRKQNTQKHRWTKSFHALPLGSNTIDVI